MSNGSEFPSLLAAAPLHPVTVMTSCRLAQISPGSFSGFSVDRFQKNQYASWARSWNPQPTPNREFAPTMSTQTQWYCEQCLSVFGEPNGTGKAPPSGQQRFGSGAKAMPLHESSQNNGTPMVTSDDKQASNADNLTMSSITGKLVLATIRGSDYAHAGEEEAIELVLSPLSSTAQNLVLDVGCGIGGTARYVHERGWGKVTGIDLDPDNISAATDRHPQLPFLCSDAVDLQRNLSSRFDLLYSLNAFFLFKDKPTALSAMRSVAVENARLAIFDYVDLGGYKAWQKHRNTPGLRDALELDKMPQMLADNGWKLDDTVPLHAEYLRWHESLVTKIQSLHDTIVAQSSERFYAYVLTRYAETCEDVRAGRLGGATLYATAT
jgi:SAM-dependent methyltransferase